MNISYSRVALYRKCPRAHYLRYVECLNKRRKAKPLYFGTDFHKLLENRNSKKKCIQAMEDIRQAYDNLDFEDRSMLGDNYIDDLFTIFNDYRKVWKGTDKPEKTEQEFEIPMFVDKATGEVHNFIGIIDEVYDGGKVIGEHKTFNMKPSNLTMTMNTQSMLYSRAVQELYGVTPEFIQWDYIKSEPSKYPVLLKSSNKLSLAKNNGITPMSWTRACKEYGIEDDLDKASLWEENISNYFFRLKTRVSEEMVGQIWDEFVQTSKEIVKRQDRNKIRNVTRDCSFCDYCDICKAEFTGGNAQYIIEKDFVCTKKADVPQVKQIH